MTRRYLKPYCHECERCGAVFPCHDNDIATHCSCGGVLRAVNCRPYGAPPVHTAYWRPGDWARWEESEKRAAERLAECERQLEEGGAE